jgi:1,5-anhydro-D-fructose reductase (1,5-anhydro-D-mannitol-forming)
VTIRWGIIGCGDVCEVKSGPAFYKAPGSSLSIVMRRNAALAADFAKRHGVQRSTASAEEVIRDPDVDAVYIATPPGTHSSYARLVASAGKPCYVEKPMARSAVECRAMIEAFERAKQPLFVAYYRRALPRFVKLKEVLGSGALGRVLAVSHVYQGRANPERGKPGAPQRTGWREDVGQAGGGLFLDLGSHVVDLLDFLLGPLTGVAGHAARRATPPGAAPEPDAPEDTVVFSFETASGVLGTARYQFHTSSSVDRLEFVGTRGTLSLSVFGKEPIDLNLGGTHERIETEHPEHVHLPLVQSIVSELTGGAERCSSKGQSALRASEVMDRVLDGFYGGRADEFWARPNTWPGAQATRA